LRLAGVQRRATAKRIAEPEEEAAEQNQSEEDGQQRGGADRSAPDLRPERDLEIGPNLVRGDLLPPRLRQKRIAWLLPESIIDYG
jgi:hypothetical protein